MASRYVRDLVRHYAGELSFFVSRKDKAGVYVEEASRKSKGVYFVRIDYFDRERHLRVGVAHQVLANTIHVFSDHWVLHQLHAGLHLLGIFFAHADFTFERVPIAHAAAANFAVADRV